MRLDSQPRLVRHGDSRRQTARWLASGVCRRSWAGKLTRPAPTRRVRHWISRREEPWREKAALHRQRDGRRPLGPGVPERLRTSRFWRFSPIVSRATRLHIGHCPGWSIGTELGADRSNFLVVSSGVGSTGGRMPTAKTPHLDCR